MKFYRDFPDLDKSKKRVVTIGTYDGVHKGHSNLLNTINSISEKENLESVLVTFEPHPRTVVSSDFKLKILTTLDEKKEVLEKYGIDNLLVINFTEEFRNLNAEEFIEKLIIPKLNPAHFVIGHDHKFGRDRKGDGDFLSELGAKYGFSVRVVPEVKQDDVTISSTLIRNSLLNGNLEEANFYLDRNYTLTGNVVEGAGRGRLIGFPTANVIPSDENKLIPAEGVYAVKIHLNGSEYSGILNIGKRPTFEENNEPVIEAHLFNFKDEIYSETLTLEFIARIREEKKFSSKEALIEQINKDIEETKLKLTN
jgi:riboflavin kinase / FMN adenylyltransferase